MKEDTPHYLAEKAEFPEQSGSMMLDLGEPIAGPYEETIPKNMIQNHITFIETAWREGAQ
jgi:hypothetical protein